VKEKFLFLFCSIFSYSVDFGNTEDVISYSIIIQFISQFNEDFNKDFAQNDLPKTFELIFTFFIDYDKIYEIKWIPPKELFSSNPSLETFFQHHIQYFQKDYLISFRQLAQNFSKSNNLLFSIFLKCLNKDFQKPLQPFILCSYPFCTHLSHKTINNIFHIILTNNESNLIYDLFLVHLVDIGYSTFFFENLSSFLSSDLRLRFLNCSFLS
jgi:hypothetical protein